MPQKAHLTRYDVEYCGLKQLRGTRSLGSFASITDDLIGWASGKRLEETQTFAAGRQSEDDFGVYCIDLARDDDTGDVVFVTWNEAPHLAGFVSSVSRESVVGQAPDLHSMTIPASDIPGFPAYFYLVPGNNRFFTIKTSSMLLGVKSFYRYVEGFVGEFSRYVVYAAQPGELGGHKLGYCEPDDKPLDNVIPRFIASPARGATTRQELIRVRKQIVRVERKIDLSYLPSREKTGFLAKMLAHLGLGEEVDTVKQGLNYKSKYSLRVTPTQPQLLEILESFSPGADNTWDDIGFHIRGRNQPIWLRKALRADDLELDLAISDQGFIPASTLLREIGQRRSAFIGRSS